MLVVLNPETITLSLSFRDGAVEIKADTVSGLVQTKTVLSYVSNSCVNRCYILQLYYWQIHSDHHH